MTSTVAPPHCKWLDAVAKADSKVSELNTRVFDFKDAKLVDTLPL